MSNGEFESTNLDELEKLEGVNLIAEWTEKDKSDELRNRLMLLELNRIYGSICYSGYLIICRTAKVLPFSRAIGYSSYHIDINDIEKITKNYNTLMIETKDLFGMNAILVTVDLVDEAYEEINKYISIAKKALEALIPEKDYDRIEQSKENNEVSDAQVDEIAEIKKYKALLDEGIITEEEFEKKKKKIMGI